MKLTIRSVMLAILLSSIGISEAQNKVGITNRASKVVSFGPDGVKGDVAPKDIESALDDHLGIQGRNEMGAAIPARVAIGGGNIQPELMGAAGPSISQTASATVASQVSESTVESESESELGDQIETTSNEFEAASELVEYSEYSDAPVAESIPVLIPTTDSVSDQFGYLFTYGGITSGHSIKGNLLFDPNLPTKGFDFYSEDGYIVGGGAGCRTSLLGGLRFEVECLKSANDLNSIDIEDDPIKTNIKGGIGITAWMASCLKEIPIGNLTAYCGGGLGCAKVNLAFEDDVSVESHSDSALAYQFIAGVDLPVSKCLSVFSQYKLLGVGETNHIRDGGAEFPLDVEGFLTHNFIVGARLGFSNMSPGCEACCAKDVISNEIFERGGYLFAYGGYSEGYEVKNSLNSSSGFETEEGHIGGAGIGCYSNFLGGCRFEIEGIHQENNITSVVTNGIADNNPDGEFTIASKMINFLKEVPLGGITCYVGGGCGIADVDLRFSDIIASASDEDCTFAYQFLAGVDLPITEQISCFTQFKHIGYGDTDFVVNDQAYRAEGSSSNHVVLGARFDLGGKSCSKGGAKVVCQPACCRNGYVFAYGGLSNGFDFDSAFGAATYDLKLEDEGYLLGGGVGCYSDFLGGSRFELEGLCQHNDVDKIVDQGVVLTGIDGTVDVTASTVNFLKEVPLCGLCGYVGGGIGVGNVDVEYFEEGERFSDSDSALVYQFIAGVDVPVCDCISLFTQYKHLKVNETDFSIIGNDLKGEDFSTNNVVVGARLSF